MLNARLAYIEFLISQDSGPCAQSLERAQEQLGSIDSDPKAQVLFPDGWARTAELEYRLDLARAACGSEADRSNELLAADAAARRAVELYRNAFDYRSMVIMQFNAGVALRRLGENAAALGALRMALDMDREYGFREDARQNYAVLLSWQGEAADPGQVDRLMRDFPIRQATLKFGWRPAEVRTTLTSSRHCFGSDGQVSTSHAAAAFSQHISADQGGGWSVSYVHPLTGYQPGVWPSTQDSQTPQMVFPPAPLPAVDFRVSATGEFAGVTEAEALASRLVARTDGIIRAGAPSGKHARRLTREALETTAAVFTADMLDAETQENYQLETAMWIGATLEQGVWYQISAPLSLPGIPRVFIQHRIEFAYTRRLPCVPGAAEQRCIEIVIRAMPDQEALGNAIADIGLVDYVASRAIRIVIDPATLLAYARDEQVYWYASAGWWKGDSILQSEDLVSTARYAAG